MHAINPVSTCGLSYAISHSLDNQVQAKNPEQGCCGVPENETSGDKEVFPDLEYIAMGMEEDHVHLHMVIPPKYAVSTVVGILKKNTSRELSKKFRFLKDFYWDNEGIWSTGFFVSMVGINEAMIRKYIEMQGKEDTGQA